MTQIEKTELRSKDIKSEQLEKLRKLFPEVVTEGKVDYERLKATLGAEIDAAKERYGMNWAGKSECFRIIQEPSIGTLKPVRSESIDFDTTENLFIEGDNLEVLKLLQKAYYEKIKMIYIDPPYNTGNDFVYNDKFGQELDEYLKLTGQVDEEGRKLSTNTDASGRYHSNWMSMMYPRLFLARNLLREDGVIFISISDDEVANLRKICDELFGEENFISIYSRISKKGSSMGKFVSPSVDYVVCYVKDALLNEGFVFPQTEEYQSKFNKEDARGKYKTAGLYQSSLDPLRGCVNQRYYIKCPDGKLVIPPGKNFPAIKQDGEKIVPKSRSDKVWRWSQESYLRERENLLFCKSKDSPLVDSMGQKAEWNVLTKQYYKSQDESKVVPGNIIEDSLNSKASDELKELNIPFDFPKPSSLIKYLSEISRTSDRDIILDFFAGSGTTAHAVLDLNKEDNGNRKFICVQLPEPTGDDSEAFKAGYKSIAEICKERIRRVIKKLKAEPQKTLSEGQTKQDFGFKVFKLDRSNFKVWDPKIESVQTALADHVNQIKDSANPEDVLYEILLKDGFELTTKIKKTEIAGRKVFSIEDNMLLICLEEKLTLDLFKEMRKLNPHRVVILDKGFNDNDQLKTNAVQSLGKNDADEYILRSI